MHLSKKESAVLQLIRRLPEELISDYVATPLSPQVAKYIRQAPRAVAQQLFVEALQRLVESLPQVSASDVDVEDASQDNTKLH